MNDNAVIQFPVRDEASVRVNDSYTNYAANVGYNTNNLSSYGTYSFTFLTRNRILLESMYRGSWIIGKAIDATADDMTQAGIDIQSTMPPRNREIVDESLEDMQIWGALNECIKWSRLYGSAIGVHLIDGQDFRTPLNIDRVGKGQYKGVLTMDRWQLVPSLGDLIDDLGPNMGKPRFYTPVPDALIPDLGPIHYSRIFRMDCIDLPHYQKQTENLWAESIVERIYDRLIAFDSTTDSTAQLVFRAYLRTWSVENLRNIISAGGPAYGQLKKNMEEIRKYQSSEGITLIDAKDKFEGHTYSFAGLDDVLMRFGEQLAGATDTPLVRLFGTPPKGMNATGESDLRTHYDNIKRHQKTRLRRPVKQILALTHRSLFGVPLPDGTGFEFNPLWQSTDAEKAEMGAKDSNSVTSAYTANVVTRATALMELRQRSKITGLWSNITDEEIADAESEPPLSEFVQTPDDIAEQTAKANGSEKDGGKEEDTV